MAVRPGLDAELPTRLGFDVRLTMRDALIVRADLIEHGQVELSNLQNTDALNLTGNPVQAITGFPVTGLQLLGIDLLEAQVLTLQNTVAVNFAGNPALAVPIPVHHGSTPVTSLQLVGRRLSEAELLNAGRLIESKH